jgi:hypothetical protein
VPKILARDPVPLAHHATLSAALLNVSNSTTP